MLKYSYFCLPGRQDKTNEDSVLLPLERDGCTFFGVADGVSGSGNGNVASSKIVDICKSIISKTQNISLKALFENVWIDYVKFIEKNEIYSAAATTFTLCKISNNQLEIGHVGDCRAYVVYKNAIEKITNDHTLRNEISKNIQSDKFYAFDNIITSCFSYKKRYVADIFSIDINNADGIFICSDGVYKSISDIEIFKQLRHNPSVDMFINALLKQVTINKPKDDYSAIYVSTK